MTIDTTTLSGLSKLMLVACDMSYKGDAAQKNDVLEPFRDTSTYDFLPPFDIANNGFTVFDKGQVPQTGFKFVIFSKGNELIVALGGTDGPDMQDWAANVRLGWDQWNGAFNTATNTVVDGTSGRASVISSIQNFLAGRPLDQQATAKIHFTGQSLGGALADYAAYEWVKILGNSASNVTLTTFNGLGSKEGLVRYGGEKQVDVNGFGGLASVAHYFVTNDLVSRLGGGHLAAAGNTYEFKFTSNQVDPRTGKPYLLDPVTAHRIETGFYQQFAKSNDPENVFNEARPGTPSLIAAGKAAEVAAQFVGLFNSKGTTELSAKYRALAGLTAAIGRVERSSDLESLLDPIIDALRDSNMIDSGLVGFLRVQGAGELKRAAQHFQYLAVTQMLTALVLERAASTTSPDQNQVLALRQLLSPDVVHKDLNTAFYGLPFFQRAAAIFAGLELIDPNSPRWGAADREALTRLGIDPQEVTRSLFAGASDVQISRNDPFNYLFGQVLKNGQFLDSLKAFFRVNKAFKGAISEIQFDYQPNLAADGLSPAAFDQAIAELKRDSVDRFRNVAEALANASPELEKKFTDAPFNFDQEFSATDYTKMVKAIEDLTGDMTLRSSLREEILVTNSIVESAGERPTVIPGAARNPFNDQNFNPDVAIPNSTVTDGGANSYTVFLPYAAAEGGQHIHVKLEGSSADKLSVVANGQTLTVTNGEFDLTITEGQRALTFALLSKDSVTADTNLTLSATLTDAAGNATHLTHNELNLTLAAPADAITADQAFTNTILGDQNAPGFDDNLGGTEANDKIIAGQGDDVITGGGGKDWILGGTGQDSLFGDEGNDLIEGGAGSDLLAGGSEYDQIYADSKGDRAAAMNSDATEPGADSDWLDGFDGNDLLVGGTGADVLTGGAGTDVLIGGAGNDSIYGDAQTAFSTTDGVIHAEVSDVSLDGADDTLFGGGGDDFMRGEVGNDALFGGAGNDRLFGDADSLAASFHGNDYLDGGAGNDILEGQGGNDDLIGGDGDDQLIGDSDALPLTAHGDDYLEGGAGNDLLRGMGGDDILTGGAGDDELQGDEGADELYGDDGVDTMDGGAGDDYLDGGAGNDFMVGGDGADALFGGEGDDQVRGGAGDDAGNTSAGNDQLAGDAGKDTFLFNLGDGFYTIRPSRALWAQGGPLGSVLLEARLPMYLRVAPASIGLGASMDFTKSEGAS